MHVLAPGETMSTCSLRSECATPSLYLSRNKPTFIHAVSLDITGPCGIPPVLAMKRGCSSSSPSVKAQQGARLLVKLRRQHQIQRLWVGSSEESTYIRADGIHGTCAKKKVVITLKAQP
jgi:hypothetical protein